jgi:hypothetical protein
MSTTRDDTARGALQGKRAALVVVIAISVVFIGSSAWQIIPAVFGVGYTPIPPSPPGSTARLCAEGVRRLTGALDRAEDTAGSASFAARLEPEWSDSAAIEAACRASPEGASAWAALVRMRSAEEQLAPHPVPEELAILRRDVIAHLPADLR